MQTIGSLKESFSQLKETQLLMKTASNEFILREKTNESFFSSGQSEFLDKYDYYIDELKKNLDRIQTTGAKLKVVDDAELVYLKTAIDVHQSIFRQMIYQIKMRGYGSYGLIGDFDKSIESLLNYDFGSDKQAVLNLKLFVKDYLLTGDENLANNISNEIYLFTVMLEKHVQDKDVEKLSHILNNYESIFKQLTEADEKLGIYTGGGLQKKLFSAIDNLDRAIRLEKINAKINEVYYVNLIKIYSGFFLIVGVAVLAAFGMNMWLYKTVVIPIQKMKSIISRMSRGDVSTSVLHFEVADLNEIANALNDLIAGTKNYQEFANNIGNGNLDAPFTPLSKEDILGNSLLAMRDSLKANISRHHTQMIELQRLNKELDNFTYHASHDLRAPLTTILGLANLGLHESTHQLHSYFKMIKNRVDHMDKLLKDIISISYNNKAETLYRRFDFKLEIHNLVDSIDPGYPFTIRLDIQQHSTFITDPVRIRTIIGNLVSNSIKYYNPEVDNPYINITVSVDAKQATIMIKDNGIGIDKEYHEKIYNMFFRATTRSTGTGLGLYIVKSMVDRLGGRIFLKSVPYEGSSFYVTIPNHSIITELGKKMSEERIFSPAVGNATTALHHLPQLPWL